MNVRVGVIGAGQAGARHARAIASSGRADLAWVADPDRGRGEELAAASATRYLPTFEEGVREADAVSICVPHALLAETALSAIEAGVHVLLEKPMATTVEDADRVIEAARRAGLLLMVGFVHRYRPEVMRAHRLIADGTIGDPVFLTDDGIGGGQSRWPQWVQQAEAGGGLLLYSVVHRIDRFRWLLGREVATVQGSLGTYLPGSDVESSVGALLTFEGGARGVVTNHFHRVELPFMWNTHVHGTDGIIRIRTGEAIEVTTPERTWREESGPERHFDGEINAFLDAIRGDVEGIPTGGDGREALKVALAIAHSHATGAPVVLTRA